MKYFKTYQLFCLLSLLLFSSCEKQNKVNWAVTLDTKNKDPYGAYLSYHSLSQYFPGAKIEELPAQFRYDNIDAQMENGDDSSSLLILEGIQCYLSETELAKIIKFARKGNEVMIFSNIIDTKLQEKFGFDNTPVNSVIQKLGVYNPGTVNEHSIYLNSTDSSLYGYNGRTIQGYFTLRELDSNKTSDSLKASSSNEDSYGDTEKFAVTVLGLRKGEMQNDIFHLPIKNTAMPDFIRYNVGEGHISFHTAPLVLSNYFLLQGNNINYLNGIWQTMPNNINRVYWNAFEKRQAHTKGMFYMLQFPAIRWAFWLAVLALLFYVLFESKRRQRIIPIINPIENSSVSFVETVGRLYYNKGNAQNLAEKMVQHFLEWVRNTYSMNTNELNEPFILQLSKRSGQPENAVRHLLEMIHEVRLHSVIIDDPYLYQLYNNIQQFYKNHTK